MTIPYGRQTLDDDDINAVVEVLRGDWLTQGPAVSAFEAAIAEACGVPYAVAFSSGTAALHGAAYAAGVRPGDELVTSAITFAASANCGAYLGAVPRFADIDPVTVNVTPESVAASLTDRTRVVIPVHFAGLPAPIAAIREAVGPNVTIIEDAAHALGAMIDDERIGECRHTEMAIFSLHPLKAITAGEAGVVTTRDPERRQQLMDFRTHGLVRDQGRLERQNAGGWYQEQQVLGFNYRLSDIHSALGRSQLAKLDQFIAARNAVADRYREWLADVDALELPPEPPPGTQHAYHLFVVRHREGAERRRRLYDGLRERGIHAQVHYVPVYLHPWYRRTYGYAKGLCPNAEDYYAGCLSLPCYPALSVEQQRQVVAAVRDLA